MLSPAVLKAKFGCTNLEDLHKSEGPWLASLGERYDNLGSLTSWFIGIGYYYHGGLPINLVTFATQCQAIITLNLVFDEGVVVTDLDKNVLNVWPLCQMPRLPPETSAPLPVALQIHANLKALNGDTYFNAVPWFEQASAKEIRKLARDNWYQCSNDCDIAIVCVGKNPQLQRPLAAADWVGCTVHKETAHLWLSANRPDVMAHLQETEEWWDRSHV